MSLSSELTDLTTNLAAAKAAVVTKGGTVGNTGLAGLEAEILGIPAPGNLQWGELEYYPFTPATCSTAMLRNLTINSAATDDLVRFFRERLYVQSSAQIEAYYWMDNGTLKCSWNGGSGNWQRFQAAELENMYNISVSLQSTDTDGHWVINYTAPTVDKQGTVTVVELTQAEFNSLGTGSVPSDQYETKNISGVDVPIIAFKKFTFGNRPTTTPSSYFLAKSGTEEIDFTYASSLTSLGSGFLYQNIGLKKDIILPESVTSIGNYFLLGSDTESFNVIGNGVTSIGQGFMQNYSPMTGQIVFPNLENIGDDFFRNGNNCNPSFWFPKLKTIGQNFLYSCSKFNQSFLIPSTVTSIGPYFMQGTNNMTGTITCEVPSSVSTASSAMEPYTFRASSTSARSVTVGITLTGTYASDWHTRFPDGSYRKTIVV